MAEGHPGRDPSGPGNLPGRPEQPRLHLEQELVPTVALDDPGVFQRTEPQPDQVRRPLRICPAQGDGLRVDHDLAVLHAQDHRQVPDAGRRRTAGDEVPEPPLRVVGDVGGPLVAGMLAIGEPAGLVLRPLVGRLRIVPMRTALPVCLEPSTDDHRFVCPPAQRLFAMVWMISSISHSSRPEPAFEGKKMMLFQLSAMPVHGAASGANSSSRLAEFSITAPWLPW